MTLNTMLRINVYTFLLSICLALPSYVSLAATNDSPSPQSSSFDAVSDLFSGFSQPKDQQLLEPDDAFNLSSKTIDHQRIQFNWEIAEGYYLYQNKIKISIISPAGLSLNDIVFPLGKEKHDEIFGDTIVYYDSLAIQQGLTTTLEQTTSLQLNVEFQGCADIGVCYPPMKKVVSLTLTPLDDPAAPAKTTHVSEQDQIAQSLSSNTLLLTCLTFLGFGILLAFTPCVFPMIPILSGIIVGHGKEITHRKAFNLSLSYVLASAFTYALFGIMAGLFGENLQASFQNPWVLSFFSLIFVALALSMFGLYQLQLPTAIQSRLSSVSQHQKHGSLWGSAMMGCLSTLIVGPCVAAPLAGVLIYIGQTGDAILGGFALFSLGMGMGIPLIIIGMSAGKLLPKAGVWMEPIKYFFGVLLLAVAIWLMERILPASISLALWATLLIISAIYLGALERLKEDASGWKKLAKGIGTLFIIYGIILMIGATSGANNPLKPLANFSLSKQPSTAHSSLPFQTIKSIDELNIALESAAKNKQLVMFDFYADWCISCKEMEAYTFSDPQVQQALSNVMLLQADVTKNNAEDKALLKAFSLIGPPAILFFTPTATELSHQRIIGYMPSDDFLQHLSRFIK